MNELIIAGIFGLLGGLARAAVGLLKHQSFRKKEKFSSARLVLTLILSGLIGMVAAFIASGYYVLPLIAGYAGGDFLESIYRSAVKE